MNKYTITLERLDELLETNYKQVFDAKKNTATELYPDIYLVCRFRINADVMIETQMKLSKLSTRNYTGVYSYRISHGKEISTERELVTQYFYDHETALEEFVDFTKQTQANITRAATLSA